MSNNKLIFGIIVCYWTIFAFCVFVSSLREQVILSRETQIKFSTFFPQGWGFFTKDPKSDILDVYRIHNNSLEIVTINNHAIENVFGFSRHSRIIGYEASMIANKVMDQTWKEDYKRNLNNIDKKPSVEIEVSKNKYLNNGRYLLILYKPVPFRWASLNQGENRLIKYIVVNVGSKK